jgi:hypothetical protein
MTPREDTLHNLANAMSAITRRAVAAYTPIVDAIVREMWDSEPEVQP